VSITEDEEVRELELGSGARVEGLAEPGLNGRPGTSANFSKLAVGVSWSWSVSQLSLAN
jgi:hypothetical protein